MPAATIAAPATKAALPTRKAEWDQAIKALGPDFADTYEAIYGAPYAMMSDPNHNRPWEVAEAQGNWYGLAAERISGRAGLSIRLVPDELGEERWLACSTPVGEGGFGFVVIAERPADGYPSGSTPTLAIKVANPKGRVGQTQVLQDQPLDAMVPGIASPILCGSSRDLSSTLHADTVVMDGYEHSLDRFLGHAFRPSEAARMLVSVEQGLDAARIRGSAISHGDIKPDNILIRFDAETGQALFAIGDLGSARKLGAPVASALTPEYAPVDQCTGTATTKHDAFAAAAVAYEMISGRPFRDDIVIRATDSAPQIEERHIAQRHESGYRAIPGSPQWEMILSGSYDPDPERRTDMTGLAARAQAFLTEPQDRAVLRPEDLTRYADFLARDRGDHDRHFAAVDRTAADALLRDPRLDDASRARLTAARRQMIEPPKMETEERVTALAKQENDCRQAQLAEAAAKINHLRTPEHASRNMGAGRQSFAEWEAQRRLETSRGADPSRGPPSRGPTR